ncbi:MAG: hypothetical protein LC689_01920 [Myxococcales bacterium]|nr:hypothetical protein [Myxococcales bacterium]
MEKEQARASPLGCHSACILDKENIKLAALALLGSDRRPSFGIVRPPAFGFV